MRALSGKLLRLSAGLGLAVPALGCTPARFLNALITKDGYRVENDIPYSSAQRHKLDIYVPEGETGDADVAVFFYGGRWTYGSKMDYRFVGQALASKGVITVIVDYRLHPDVRFPSFVEDAAKAVGWVHRRIAEHGGDPGRIHLVGHSAGAHIAAMLSLAPRFLAAEDVGMGDVRGFVGLAGPYDFLPIQDPIVKDVFSVDDLDDTQPITHANGRAPDTLLLTGGADDTVLPRNSMRLGDAIAAAGGEADVKVYDGIGHIGVVLALAAPFRWLAPTLSDISAFIERSGSARSQAA